MHAPPWPLAALALAACGGSAPFTNAYAVPGDDAARAPPGYFLRRAWVQLTRDLERTPLPPTVPLDLAALERAEFAVAWLGHSALLVRAGGLWILMDPTLFRYVGPVRGFGPERLTPLPLHPDQLPHIDVVAISHDHYDHLDLASVRTLSRQEGGPPRFLVGAGLGAWFAENVGVQARDFAWWDRLTVGEVTFTFVPAQHSSGRSVTGKNRTLWGGWVVEWRDHRFWFAGDTAYVKELFTDLRARVGPIDLAAIPIGAYRPRAWMRYEHVDPAEAVQVHLDVGARRSFAVHWATFQLGDEEPIQPARDLAEATHAAGVDTFVTLSPGEIAEVFHTR